MDVTNIRYLDGFRLALEFSDGTHGVADLAQTVQGSLSASVRELADLALFRRVSLENGAATWPVGVDLATERLYALAHGLQPPPTFEEAQANEVVGGQRGRR